MKKQLRKDKLAIHRETLRRLTGTDAHKIVGGTLFSDWCTTVPSATACGTSTVCYSVHCTLNTKGCTPNEN